MRLSKITLGVKPKHLCLEQWGRSLYTHALACFCVPIGVEIRYNYCGFRGKVLCHRMVVLPTAFDAGYESQKAGSNENLQVQNVF